MLERAYRAICSAAGLPSTFTLKMSRHSCASALINADVPLKMVSDRLGHTTIKTKADIYGVVDEERARQVSERVGQLFGIGKSEVFAAFASRSHTTRMAKRFFDSE